MDGRARYKEREKKRDEGERKRKRDDQEEYGQDEFGEVMDLVMGLWLRQAPKRQPERTNKRKGRLGLNHQGASQNTKQRLEVSCTSKLENDSGEME